MVRVFLSGPGGSGKTTLANALKERFKVYEHISEVARHVIARKNITKEDIDKFNMEKFIQFQEDILEAQVLAEKKVFTCRNLVSDRSVLDCLAYVLWKTEKDYGYAKMDAVIAKHTGLIKEAMSGYQKSLMVLVQPWCKNGTADDGVRLSMTFQECSRFTEILKELLNKFRIGFLCLNESDRNKRLKILQAALEGNVKRKSYNLIHYMELSSKQQKKGKSSANQQRNRSPSASQHSRPTDRTTISFYLDQPDSKSTYIRSTKICEDQMRLHFTEIGAKRGRLLDIVQSENWFCIEFDMKVRQNDVQKILLEEIYVNGEQFSFLGCSSAGLKSRKAFLLKGDAKSVKQTLSAYGDFHEIPSVSKRMARISLLFSSVHLTEVEIDPDSIVTADDILSSDRQYNFTDGCGGIGIDLAEKIYIALPQKERVDHSDYRPAVYQFRLQGLKGVVALDTRIGCNKLLVRPSMNKFKTSALPFICICDFSRPYSYGHLNRQLLYLLSALGVEDENFLAIQRDCFTLLSEMYTNPEAAIALLHWYGKLDVAKMLMTINSHGQCSDFKRSLNYQEEVQNALKAIEREYLKRDKKQRGDGTVKEKLRIMVKDSRLLYGVSDQTNKLKYGQCFLRITINNKPKTITGNIATGRMPCYLLGDIRVLKAVDLPDLNHLVDCIVFPTQGERPHADEQAGGDLDGDKFFVTWDSRIIPPKIVQSHEYPAAEAKREGVVTLAKMIMYFSIQNQAMKVTGLLANLYEQWADARGPQSEECTRIGQLFGRAIDATKTGERVIIPENLLKPPKVEGNKITFVWQEMEKQAKIFKSKLVITDVQQVRKGINSDEITEDYVFSVLEEDVTSLSEYEKFDFLWRYSINRFQDEMDAAEYINRTFLPKINFALFTSTEKLLAIDAGIPASIVDNAFTKSTIISMEDLEHFQMLKSQTSWGVLFRAQHDEFYLHDLLKKLPYYDAVFICFELPDEVIICLKIMQQLRAGMKHALTNFTAILISKSFGYRKQFQPKSELYYDLEEDRLQIYRNQNLAQSFLWLRSKNVQSRNQRGSMIIEYNRDNDVQDCISVDLASFDGNILRASGTNKPHPLVRKTPVTQIEVFASKGGFPAYPDVYAGNELEEVRESENEDLSEEGPDRRDVCQILIDQIKEMEVVEMSVAMLKGVFDQLVACCVPWTGETSIETKSALESLLAKAFLTKTLLKDLVHIAICLCRLGHISLAKRILLEWQLPAFSTKDFLEILENWTMVFYLQPQILVEFVKILVSLLLSKDEISKKERYLVNLAWNNFIEFTNDITLCKESLSSWFIANLKVEWPENSSDGDNGSVSMYRTSPLQRLSNLPANGEHVILIRERDWKKQKTPSSAITIASVIHAMPAPFSVKLNLVDAVTPAVMLQDSSQLSSKWMINIFGNANINVYRRVIKACQILLLSHATNSVCDLIMGENNQTHQPAGTTQPANDIEINELNSAQKIAVSVALKNSLTLVHGPPGTGKTKVACAILQKAAKKFTGNKSAGVLAVAETNTAVDNMTRRLFQMGLDVVRIGNVKHVPGDLYGLTLEGQLRLMAEKECKQVLFRTQNGTIHHKKNFVKKILDKAMVVLTTCAGTGESILADRNFEFVLVDEATQTKEGTVLCALAHKAEQLVMIGDPNQLGPLIKIENNWDWLSNDDYENVTKSLEETLFHRLTSSCTLQPCFLDTQYRMHPSIAEFPSKSFYDGQLKSGTTNENRKPLWKFTTASVAFLNVEGHETRIGTSYGNNEEACKISEIINILLKNSSQDLATKDIAVLALYNGQVRRLRGMLPSVEVSSIDGFQGREAEIILVSTVRTRGNLGYSDDKRRLNVLLTRARRGLLVVGHRQTLSTSSIWSTWIESVHQLDDIALKLKI